MPYTPFHEKFPEIARKETRLTTAELRETIAPRPSPLAPLLFPSNPPNNHRPILTG
jgi:hypothetical protein